MFYKHIYIAGAHFTTNASDSQSEGSSVSGRRSVQMPGEEICLKLIFRSVNEPFPGPVGIGYGSIT